MDYENMTILEIINHKRWVEHLELFQEIRNSKEIELLKLHNILVYKHLKRTEPDLAIRNRMFKVYIQLVTKNNLESCYNLEIRVFIHEFFECKLKGITT